MPVSVGNTILAADYNTLRNTVSGILATNYGQTLISTAASAGSTSVSVTQKLNLFLDIQRTHVHHTNALNTNIAVPTTGVTIGADTSEAYNQTTGVRSSITDGTRMGYNDFESAVTTLSNFNPSTIGIWPTASFTLGTATNSSRSTAWGGTTPQIIYHVVTVTFSSQTIRDQYFNAGGEIRFSGSLTGGSGAKDTDWASLLTSMGSIRFSKWRLTADSGTPEPTGSGYDSLTSTYRTLFIKTGSGVYDDNEYIIEGRIESTTTLRFRIRFNDGDVGTGDPNFPLEPGTDESVGGTTTSSVNSFRPDSTFTYNSTTYDAVRLSAPTITTQVAMTTDNASPPA
jgi:hypothetical protein